MDGETTKNPKQFSFTNDVRRSEFHRREKGKKKKFTGFMDQRDVENDKQNDLLPQRSRKGGKKEGRYTAQQHQHIVGTSGHSSVGCQKKDTDGGNEKKERRNADGCLVEQQNVKGRRSVVDDENEEDDDDDDDDSDYDLDIYPVQEKISKSSENQTVEKAFKCEFCDKSFSHNSHYLRHTRTHTGERPFKCSVCGSTFLQNIHLTRHMRMHSGERPYICKHCGKSFARNGILTRHIRIHSGEKPYKCEYCGKTFSVNGNLSRHVKIHLEKKLDDTEGSCSLFDYPTIAKKITYKCKHCNQMFISSENLRLHMHLHPEVKSEKFDCKDVPYPDIDNIINELPAVNSDKSLCRFECCGNVYTSVSAFDAHALTHDEEFN